MSQEYFSNIKIELNQEIPESVFFSYIQSYIKILYEKTELNQVAIIDSMMVEIYTSFQTLHQNFLTTNQQLSKTLGDFTKMVDNYKIERVNIYDANKDREQLMEKLSQSTDYSLQLLKQNQVIYETMSKMEQINLMLNEKVRVLELTLQKQRKLGQQNLDFEKNRNNIYLTSQNEMKQNFKKMNNDYSSLIQSNKQLKTQIQQITTSAKQFSKKYQINKKYLILLGLASISNSSIKKLIWSQIEENIQNFHEISRLEIEDILSYHYEKQNQKIKQIIQNLQQKPFSDNIATI